MGGIQSVDNEQWVNQHISSLAGRTVDETFNYVALHHPLQGLARPRDELLRIDARKLRMAEAAKYADAVMVARYVEIGNDPNEPGPCPPGTASTVTFGNAAFIALRHPSKEVRHRYRQFFESLCRV